MKISLAFNFSWGNQGGNNFKFNSTNGFYRQRGTIIPPPGKIRGWNNSDFNFSQPQTKLKIENELIKVTVKRLLKLEPLNFHLHELFYSYGFNSKFGVAEKPRQEMFSFLLLIYL